LAYAHGGQTTPSPSLRDPAADRQSTNFSMQADLKRKERTG
jgi:hypothetical protein